MADNTRQHIIFIPPELDTLLDEAKNEIYFKNSDNEMIQDLILRGLQESRTRKALQKQKGQ